MQDLQSLHQKLDALAAEIQAIRQLLSNQTIRAPDFRPLNSREAAAFLHLKVGRIHQLVYEKKLIPLSGKKHCRLLFRRESLLNYITKNKNPNL
jgi:primosomal protein N''